MPYLHVTMVKHMVSKVTVKLSLTVLCLLVHHTAQQSAPSATAGTHTLSTPSPPCFSSNGQSCQYTCHCMNDASCDAGTGACPNHLCAVGWSGVACQTSDVAFGKHATATSQPEAGRCVDHMNNTCCFLQVAGSNEYWEVSLGGVYTLERAVISEDLNAQRAGGIRKVYVELHLNGQPVHRKATDDGWARVRQLTFTPPVPADKLRVRKLNANYRLKMCELLAYGYPYTECNPYQGSYYYGPACVHQCPSHTYGPGCTGQCNFITGARECTTCIAGYRYVSSSKECRTCARGKWGINCGSSCNCKDSTEACNLVNGNCTSGCADWFLDFGCDYELPRLGNNILPSVTANGKRVTVQFTMMHATRKRRATANSEDVVYKIQYQRLNGNNHEIKVIDTTWQDEDDSVMIGIVILPALREMYSVCVVPYDNVRRLAGEPSACVPVLTQCVDGEYGSDCQYECTCKNIEEICNKTTGGCTSCEDVVRGLACKLVIPDETSILVTYVPGVTDIHVNIEIVAQSVSRCKVTCIDNTEEQYGIEIMTNEEKIISGNIEDLQRSRDYTCHVIPVLADDFGEYPGVALHWQTVTTHNKTDSSTVPAVVGTIVVLTAVAGVVAFIWFRKRRTHKDGPVKCCITGKAKGGEESYVNGHISNVDNATYENAGAQLDDVEPAADEDVYQNPGLINEINPEKKPKVPLIKPEKKTKPALQLKKPVPPPSKPSALALELAYRPISLKDFADHMTILNSTDYNLATEFNDIPEGSAPCQAAEKPVNSEKHRFLNIKAYDHSRVILHVSQGMDPDSDYINACYIRSYHGNRTMIASQAPRIPTLDDTWRMIWQEDVNQIVMLTNLKEINKVKCQRYWPKEGVKQYAAISVELLSSTSNSFYTERRIRATKGEEARMITQIQYRNWPDHGVPNSTHEILYLYYKIKSLEQSRTGPLLVHCSAGVGRSGTFIGLEWLLEQSRAEKRVDLVRCVRSIREDRTQMVQSIQQYRFLYQLLYEALTIGNTAIIKDKYKMFMVSTSYEAVTKNQLLQMNKIYPSVVSAHDCSDALKPENVDKTRGGADMAPANNTRLFLSTGVSGHNDYINAVSCHSFNKKHSMIMTQLPLPDTVADMWRLVYDHSACGIVLLENIPSDEVAYWPQDDETDMSFGPLSVKFVNESSNIYDGVSVRDFTVEHNNNPNDVRNVRQWHLTNWGESVESVSPNILKVLIDLSTQYANKLAGRTTIVQCFNGVNKSGLYVAFNNLIEMMVATKTIDVCFVVKQVRSNRPQAIRSGEQLQLLYKWMDDTLSDIQEYYN